MATTTPNYGWTVPTSTDYVKDGATAIETLGDAIDATSAGANMAGLVFLKRQTIGSAVTTVTVSSAFSSTYDNYRIMIQGVSCSLANSFRLMMGTGATTQHDGAAFYYQYTGVQFGYLTANNAGSIYLALTDSSNKSTFVGCDIMSPNAAAPTGMHGTAWGRTHTSYFAGTANNTTQYTSFTLLTDGAGTMTGGTIDLYGYRKAV